MSVLQAPVIQKAEDAAHVSGDRGIVALAVRTDTATARAGTDGDYIPLIVDASGRAHVNAGALLGVTAKGQATMPDSLPVAIASNQSAIPVTTSAAKLVTANIAASTVGATASTYSASDVIGGLITLANVLDDTSFRGKMHKVLVRVVEIATPKALDVLIFNANPTASAGGINNSQGLVLHDDDDEKVIDIIHFAATDFAGPGSDKYAVKELNRQLVGAADDLYAIIISAESDWVWGTANGLGIEFQFEQIP